MKTIKKSNGAVVTGIISAIAASSCCIPPVIAAVAGLSGGASSLSWIEPFRPYLIAFAILSIGYAWYTHLKPKQADDCGCDIEKLKFYQKRGFLIGITLFAVISITFPYYSHIFYSSNTSKEIIIIKDENLKKIEVQIEGMTCDACQNHVNQSVLELPGVINANTSYDNANAIIEFDKTKTTENDIEKAVNSTGYLATKINEIK